MSTLPSHGRGHRFDPCIAHHFLSTFPGSDAHHRAERCVNARPHVGESWGNLFSKRSENRRPLKGGRHV